MMNDFAFAVSSCFEVGIDMFNAVTSHVLYLMRGRKTKASVKFEFVLTTGQLTVFVDPS